MDDEKLEQEESTEEEQEVEVIEVELNKIEIDELIAKLNLLKEEKEKIEFELSDDLELVLTYDKDTGDLENDSWKN